MKSQAGLTLIEILIAIALIGLVFFAIASGLRASLYLITEGKVKTTANAIASEQMERIRSLEYQNVGTFIQDGDCPTYDTSNPDCVVGVPAGPIPQIKTENLNNIDFTIYSTIEHVDDPSDGLEAVDENGVINDYKQIEIRVEWNGRSETEVIRLTSTVSPLGVESSAGGGSLRVNAIDSTGEPVSGLDVVIKNDTTSPAVSQPGVTNVDGRRLLSGLPQASGYEVYVNITEGLSLVDTSYGYARTFEEGEVFPYDGASTAITAPNPDKLTVDEGLVTSITFVIDKVADLGLQVNDEPYKEVITAPFFDSSTLTLSNTEVVGGQINLSPNPATGGLHTFGYATTESLAAANDLEQWLWFYFSTSGEGANKTISAQFYFDDSGVDSLIPEGNLPGNAAGFSSSDGPIDLQDLDPDTYSDLSLRFNFSGDGLTTPALTDASLYAAAYGDPISDANLRIYSAEWVGNKADEPANKVPKYDFVLSTDVAGRDFYQDLSAGIYNHEWKVVAGDYTEIYTCPDPSNFFALNPSSEINITSVWRGNTSAHNTLTVRVENSEGSRVYPGVQLTLLGDLLPRKGITNSCGQYTFGDVPAGTLNLNLVGPDVPARDVSVTISGSSEHLETI